MCKYQNFYYCDDCNTGWDLFDDSCDKQSACLYCNSQISPYESQLIMFYEEQEKENENV